jgi:hypothetical protein
MATELARAHILSQERLRALVVAAAGRIWGGLPGYDRQNIDEWLSGILPVVAAAQRQSIALTDAYLARALERQPLGIDPADASGAAVRAGTPPEQVYRRPFVTVWTALQGGTQWEDAVHSGLARATSTAATDVQLSMRRTLQIVGEEDELILGYQRVTDGDACAFCRLVAGQRYHTSQLMPIHNHCGCGVDVITGEQRPDFTGQLDNDRVAVREHGEMGPVLVDPAQAFTSLGELVN